MRYLANVTSLEFFPEKCVGCGRCIEVCPHAVFGMEGKSVSLVDRDACMECGACAQNCAFEAIKVNSGVGCAYAIINSMINGRETACGCSLSKSNGEV